MLFNLIPLSSLFLTLVQPTSITTLLPPAITLTHARVAIFGMTVMPIVWSILQRQRSDFLDEALSPVLVAATMGMERWIEEVGEGLEGLEGKRYGYKGA